jgi:hypothetical protein
MHPDVKALAVVLGLALSALSVTACWDAERRGPATDDTTRDETPTMTEASGFIDIAPSVGMKHTTFGGSKDKLTILENIGSGAGFVDADGDGLLDVVVLSGGVVTETGLRPDPALRFYRQSEANSFHDQTKAWGLSFSGWGTGLAVGDVDNDGDPDLLITCYGQDRFFRNVEGRRFEDATATAGFLLADATSDFSTSAVFFDYNADGLLDVYVVRYVELDPARPPNSGRPCLTGGVPVACAPHFHPPLADRLYRNTGDTFVDVTQEAGVAKTEGAYGLGVAAADFNGDGRADLYVANDTTPNFFWRNVDGKRFVDEALFSGCALDDEGRGQAGMGVDVADLDGNGTLDIVVTNYSQETNALYANLGAALFEDRSRQAKLWQPSYLKLGWGVKACDWDRDGRLDLAIANGHVYPRATEINPALSYPQSCLFLRAGATTDFVDDSLALGPDASATRTHRALATGDIDNDGDTDLLLSVVDSPPVLLQNNVSPSGKWLSLRLEGTRSNRDALGAKVWLTVDRRVQFREVTRGGSYLAAHDPRLLFGLGQTDGAKALRIIWPSGVEEIFGALAAHTAYKIVEGSGSAEVIER